MSEEIMNLITRANVISSFSMVYLFGFMTFLICGIMLGIRSTKRYRTHVY